MNSTLEKEKVSFESLQGSTTVVYFFASWCSPCYETLENLQRVVTNTKPSVTVIAASLDEEWDSLYKMLAMTGFTGAVWKSGNGKAPLQEWKFANYARSLPYAIKISQQGILTEQSFAIKTEQQWLAVLTENASLEEAVKRY